VRIKLLTTLERSNIMNAQYINRGLKMEKQKTMVMQDILDKLDDNIGLGAPAEELHNELCNTDYYIIGTYQSKIWLGDHVFDAIEKIKNYELGQFGEHFTDCSCAEKVANMLAYILGEEILGESPHLRDCWGRQLTEEDIKTIKNELNII